MSSYIPCLKSATLHQFFWFLKQILLSLCKPVIIGFMQKWVIFIDTNYFHAVQQFVPPVEIQFSTNFK